MVQLRWSVGCGSRVRLDVVSIHRCRGHLIRIIVRVSLFGFIPTSKCRGTDMGQCELGDPRDTLSELRRSPLS